MLQPLQQIPLQVMTPPAKTNSTLSAASLFSGVGGFELGLARAGIETVLVCEIDTDARRVLESRFKGADIAADVIALKHLPKVDILTAGFPCQDLSQVGRATGIHGPRSGLIHELFRLLSKRGSRPRYVILENVPFMLNLNKGHAMSVVTEALEDCGYTWAYRTVDARSFGLPQRRRRVIIVASNKDDPRSVLLSDEASDSDTADTTHARAFGFYWTEGNTGIGWAPGCLPALKPGSGLSIPSPPALWRRDKHDIRLPHIRDAERLQGFPEDWTIPRGGSEEDLSSARARWRLVGNALPVPISAWIGRRLMQPGTKTHDAQRLPKASRWTGAGWGHKGYRFAVAASEFPIDRKWPDIGGYLSHPTRPLSARATLGFLTRLKNSSLRKNDRFLRDLAAHYKMQVE